MKNIAYYMVLITAVIQVLPNQEYKKYVRFFTGMVLVMLLANPILSIFGMEHRFSELYDGQAYEEATKEMKSAAEFREELDQAAEHSEYIQENNSQETDSKNEQGIKIEVGEVRIGR